MARLNRFAVAAALAFTVAAPAAAIAADCPEGGTIRFGVEPYDAAARLVPIYQKVGKLIGDKLGCKVEVFVATSYNAEIEAMRNGKLEIGEFGPLGYVLAHQIAKAEAVSAFGDADGKPNTYWASLVTYPQSGIKTVADIKGHSFAFSDPASTSGHLFPAYGLRKGGIDPDKDIKPIYAGSHTSSFEALYNHKVDAGELNSEQLESAKQRGHYKDGDLVFLWKSDPIPTDPFSVRGDLPADFKKRVTEVLQNLDLSSLDPADRKIMVGAGITRLVPQTDHAYDGIRDLVKTAQHRFAEAELTLAAGSMPMLHVRGLTMRYPNGARRIQVFTHGVVPSILPSLAGIALYRFDENIRSSLVLGFVGAGGIGFELLSAMSLFQYRLVSLYLIVTFVLVIAAERMSALIRARLA